MLRRYFPVLILAGGACFPGQVRAQVPMEMEAVSIEGLPTSAESASFDVPTPGPAFEAAQVQAWEHAAFQPLPYPSQFYARSLPKAALDKPIGIAARAALQQQSLIQTRFPALFRMIRGLGAVIRGGDKSEQPGDRADIGKASRRFFDQEGKRAATSGADVAAQSSERDPRLDALKDKSLVLVGYAVGPHHLEYIRELHSFGVKVQLVFLRDSQEALDVMARTRDSLKPYVDHIIEVNIPRKSGEDYDSWQKRIAGLAAAEVENAGVERDGILSFVEENIAIKDMMAEHWGLPHAPVEAIRILRDKGAFPAVLQRLGLPYVPTVRIRRRRDLERAARKIGFPGLLKPATGASAYGVLKVNDAEQLASSYKRVHEKVLQESRPNRDGVRHNATFDPKRGIVYQKPIKGWELDFDGVYRDDEEAYGDITDNHPVREGSFAPTGLNMPSELPDDMKRQVREIAHQLLKALGVKNILVHFEFIVSEEDGRAYLIDANPRLGGRPVFPLHRDVKGVNLVAESAFLALNIPGPVHAGPIKHPAVWGTVVFPPHGGTLVEVKNWDRMIEDPRVWKGGSYLLSQPGTHMEASDLQMNRVFAMRAAGENLKEAKANHPAVIQDHKLEIIVEPDAPARRK